MTRALQVAEPSAVTPLYEGLQTVRAVLAPDLSNEELLLFAMVAQRSGLDPFARQIFAVKREGRVTFQTGIDGYRSIAARSGEYDGQDEPEYGPACPCGEAPPGHPESATVRVYRKGVDRPIGATAYWHEYKPGPGKSGQADAMWRRMPRVMIGKVAEALALRKGFPWDPTRGTGIGADLYTADEMAQAERPAPPPTTRERIAARRAALEPPAPEEAAPQPAVAPEEAGADSRVGPEPLSREEFLSRLRVANIGAEEAVARAHELYPGRRTTSLSDEERGALWAALSERDELPEMAE